MTQSALPPSLNIALRDLEQWNPPGPDWEPLRQRVAMILRAAFTRPGSPVPALDPGDEQTAFLLDRIREGWAEGVPAVRVIAPALDHKNLLHRVKCVDDCADRDHPPARRFRELLMREPERIAELAAVFLNDGEAGLLAAIEETGLEPAYTLSTLRLSLLGELGEWSQRITAQLGEASWPRGDCPVCGAEPALAESRGLEQRRHLRCDRCAAGWLADRMRCPFCAQSDHRALRSVFAEEDHDRCCLVVCDGCGGRLRVITTLAPLSPPGLVLAQFTMLYLDFIDAGDVHEEPAV